MFQHQKLIVGGNCCLAAIFAAFLLGLGPALPVAAQEQDHLAVLSRLTAPEALLEAAPEAMPKRFAHVLLLLQRLEAQGLPPQSALESAMIRNETDPLRRDTVTAHLLRQYRHAKDHSLLVRNDGAVKIKLRVRTILAAENFPDAARELINYQVAIPAEAIEPAELSALREETAARIAMLPKLERIIQEKQDRRERQSRQAIAVAEAQAKQPVVVNNVIKERPVERETVIYHHHSSAAPVIYPRPRPWWWYERPHYPSHPYEPQDNNRRTLKVIAGNGDHEEDDPEQEHYHGHYGSGQSSSSGNSRTMPVSMSR